LIRLWRVVRLQPYVFIVESGTLATNRRIHVGFHGRTGICEALTLRATELDHARATLYARSCAQVTGLPIVDRRAASIVLAQWGEPQLKRRGRSAFWRRRPPGGGRGGATEEVRPAG
jgi:hypothetical protein